MSDAFRVQKHERLVRRMAEANGVDLELAELKGDFGPEEFRSAVLACTGCSDPHACEERLKGGHTGTPAYCRNGDIFRRLSGITPDPD